MTIIKKSINIIINYIMSHNKLNKLNLNKNLQIQIYNTNLNKI